MSANTLELPIGNGVRLRITRNPASHGVTVQMVRGRWPKCTNLAFFVACADELRQIRIRKNGLGEQVLWVVSACIDVNAPAAKRISAWLAAHGIGEPGAAPEAGASDALDRLDLNTDTPAPAAPGGAA